MAEALAPAAVINDTNAEVGKYEKIILFRFIALGSIPNNAYSIHLRLG